MTVQAVEIACILALVHGDRSGQMDSKSCPRARGTIDGQPAAVAVEDVLDEGQPQPGPALGAAFCDIDAVEPLGEAGQVFRRDPGPIIPYADLRLRLPVRRRAEPKLNVDAPRFCGRH